MPFMAETGYGDRLSNGHSQLKQSYGQNQSSLTFRCHRRVYVVRLGRYSSSDLVNCHPDLVVRYSKHRPNISPVVYG